MHLAITLPPLPTPSYDWQPEFKFTFPSNKNNCTFGFIAHRNVITMTISTNERNRATVKQSCYILAELSQYHLEVDHYKLKMQIKFPEQPPKLKKRN